MTEQSKILPEGQTFASVSDQISAIVLSGERKRSWVIGLLISFALVMLLFLSITYLLLKGVGVWGINIPVGWGFAITNFVWWIGIGHAGTFISAILLLLRQKWRTSINRFAEAMTLFAVACAGLFPLLHMGRPQLFYWLLPYPNTLELWPQFRSPLVWDVFAVTTYLIVSLVFWFIGLVPDFAVLRDRAQKPVPRTIYAVLAMGWRGAAHHWQRYDTAYLILAALATPLVISVHSIVSLDFTVAQLPGWHSTIFPPYFVAGAIFSGFAMVLTLAIPLRKVYHLENFITLRHLENSAKILLAMGLVVAYSYATELFMGWYGGDVYEQYVLLTRFLTGPYAPLYWLLIFCNILTPQILWFKRARNSIWTLFIVSLLVNVGMWLERFLIVVTSLHRDFLPSSWGMFYPTFWDISLLLGSLGLFTFLFFIFLRILPVIAISEMQKLVEETK